MRISGMGRPLFASGYGLTQSWLNLHTLSIDRLYQLAAKWRPLPHARSRRRTVRTSGGMENEKAHVVYLRADCLLPLGTNKPGTERDHRLGGHRSACDQQFQFTATTGKL